MEQREVIGRTLSHFRILAKIGEGGMGVVYRAEDVNLRRTVALKVLPPDLVASEDRRLRFLREARAAAAVSHPNIATIYEVGEADGLVFIAMELIEGETLRARIGGRAMPAKEALPLAIEIAEGLARAHQGRVIHRDLKPDNIVVTSEGHAKILDFGLAKLLEEDGDGVDGTPGGGGTSSRLRTGSGQVTREGTIFGTVAYMSPEQARGDEVDARSDIFAFGVTLYEMVTGQAPFRGRTSADTLGEILKTEPPPAASVSPGLPAALDRLIAKCLRKERQDRYQHTDEIVVDLREVRRQSDSGVHAVAGPGAVRTGWRRALVPAIVTAAIVAAGSGVAFNLGGLRDRLIGAAGQPSTGSIRSIAVLPLENLARDPEQEYFADGMTEELITSLARISALKVISRTSVMRYKGTTKSIPEIARELGVEGVVEGSVRQAGGRVRVTAQLIDAATDRHVWADAYERDLREVLTLQSEVAQAIARAIQIALTPQEEARLAGGSTVDPEAHEAYLKGRYYWNKRSSEGFQKAIEYFQQALEKDPNYALAYSGIADSYNLLADYSYLSVAEALPKAKAAAMKAVELDGSLAEARTSLASVHEMEWDWSGAEEEYRRAIQLNPNLAGAHHWYAVYLRNMGREQEGIAEIEQAVTLDPLSPIILANAGMQYLILGDPDRAIEHFRKALEIDPRFAVAYRSLGQAYLLKGSTHEAVEAFRRFVEIEPASMEAKAFLAHALAVTEETGEARSILSGLGSSTTRQHVSCFDLALVHIGLRENDQALSLLEKAYEQHEYEFCDYLLTDQRLDPLRSEPRFKALLRKMDLPGR